MKIRSDDTWGNRIKWTIVKFKNRIQRGQHWLSFFNILIYVGALANLQNLNRDPAIAYIFGISYVITCWIIGYIDEKHGIWKMEAIWGSQEMNPAWIQLERNIDKLEKKIDKLIERE